MARDLISISSWSDRAPDGEVFETSTTIAREASVASLIWRTKLVPDTRSLASLTVMPCRRSSCVSKDAARESRKDELMKTSGAEAGRGRARSGLKIVTAFRELTVADHAGEPTGHARLARMGCEESHPDCGCRRETAQARACAPCVHVRSCRTRRGRIWRSADVWRGLIGPPHGVPGWRGSRWCRPEPHRYGGGG